MCVISKTAEEDLQHMVISVTIAGGTQEIGLSSVNIALNHL